MFEDASMLDAVVVRECAAALSKPSSRSESRGDSVSSTAASFRSKNMMVRKIRFEGRSNLKCRIITSRCVVVSPRSPNC